MTSSQVKTLNWILVLLIASGCTSVQKYPSQRKNKTPSTKVQINPNGEDPAKAYEQASLWFQPKFVKVDDQRLAVQEKALAQNSEDMKLRIATAELQAQALKWERVIETLRPQADSLDRRGLLLLARAYGYQKNYLATIRVLEILKGKFPDDYYAEFVLAESYLRLANSPRLDPSKKRQHRERALQGFHDSKQKNPDFLAAYEGILRQIEITPESNSDAINLIQDMISRFGMSVKSQQRLCRAYRMAGYVKKAVDTCESAVELSPNEADSYIDLSISYKMHEEHLRAHSVMVDAAKKFPKSLEAQLGAGDLFWDLKNYPTALEYYETARKNHPERYEGWLGTAKCQVELSKFQEALKNYREACSLNSKVITDFKRGSGRVRSMGAPDFASKFEESYGQCGSKEKSF